MKYVVLFSGGHGSALTAIEAVRKYGRHNVVLLNHDISSQVEHEDIKRFKVEVAETLQVPLIFANAKDFEKRTPLHVCMEHRAFTGTGNRSQTICTHHLKTKPFYEWLKNTYPVRAGGVRGDVCFLYGMLPHEVNRIDRRTKKMWEMGYLTDYPLCWKERTISSVEEIGVQRPSTYDTFLHANCTGCLKAGKMHWYATYCLRPDIYEEAVLAEEVIGYSILKNVYLKELKEEFEDLKRKNIQPTDCSCCGSSFFANARRTVSGQLSLMDCFHLV